MDKIDIDIENNTKKLNKTEQFIIYFFLFSFIGWLLETCFSFYALGHFTKRGFLYGPLCPIYGFGGLMLIAFFTKFRTNNFKLFFYASIVFSVFEYLVSYCLEALFTMHWWDYTNEFLNLNGRISIFYSFAWGVIAILFVNHIFPFFYKKTNLILEKVPYIVQKLGLYLICTIYIIDTIASSVRYLT